MKCDCCNKSFKKNKEVEIHLCPACFDEFIIGVTMEEPRGF